MQLAAAAVPGSGRGLVASQAIGKGEAVLHIPPQLLLTPAVALQRSALLGLLEGRPLPAWSVLALWLAEARAALSEAQQALEVERQRRATAETTSRHLRSDLASAQESLNTLEKVDSAQRG